MTLTVFLSELVCPDWAAALYGQPEAQVCRLHLRIMKQIEDMLNALDEEEYASKNTSVVANRLEIWLRALFSFK